VRQSTGSYNFAIHVIALAMFCSLVVGVLARWGSWSAIGRGRRVAQT
jgi:hypothetical protein